MGKTNRLKNNDIVFKCIQHCRANRPDKALNILDTKDQDKRRALLKSFDVDKRRDPVNILTAILDGAQKEYFNKLADENNIDICTDLPEKIEECDATGQQTIFDHRKRVSFDDLLNQHLHNLRNTKTWQGNVLNHINEALMYCRYNSIRVEERHKIDINKIFEKAHSTLFWQEKNSTKTENTEVIQHPETKKFQDQGYTICVSGRNDALIIEKDREAGGNHLEKFVI